MILIVFHCYFVSHFCEDRINTFLILIRWVIEQTYPPSCVGVRDMPLPAVEVSQLALLNLVVNNNIRRTNFTFWGFILKLTLRSFEGSKSSFVKLALSMFERDNSVFAGVVFTLDTHNQILRTGCHAAVAAIGNVGKYHVNDSTAYNSSYGHMM